MEATRRVVRRRGLGVIVGVLCLLGARAGQAGDTLAVGGLEELGNPALVQAMLTYYEAEKAGDWETTYALRGPGFARIVPFETYVRQMELDAEGWELLGIEGRSVGGDGAVVSVTLNFSEALEPAVATRLLGPELAGPDPQAVPQRYTQPEVTQWVELDGQWLALAPGARQHFVFNERLVWDDAPPPPALPPTPVAGQGE
ncbi:MAG: hypothetical protein AB7P42_12555 [Gammaproteobacteria bacterium]